MYSACGSAVLPALGFPIRESADHGLFSASPRLIAAVHALLRLLVPRHPPCALLILTVIRHVSGSRAGEAPGDTRCRWRSSRSPPRWHGCAVFKVRFEARPRIGGSVSQNSTACARWHARGVPAAFAAWSGPRGQLAHEWAGERQVRSTFRNRLELGDAECVDGTCRRSNPGASLERRGSSRTFRYGYLVTTSPQSRAPPSTAPSQRVRPPASGVACFRGVTGGVYKARERIHRGSADPRLLATPLSCRRVSACNPNRDAL